MDKTMREKILRKIYYDETNPAGYSGALKLYRAAVLEDRMITLKQVKDFLSGQLTYTLHRRRRVRFDRNPIICDHVDEQWQADLVDMQQYAKVNSNNKYILTVIDVLSRFGFAQPIKDKSATSILRAFKVIIKYRKPSKLQTDQGKEFKNKTMLAFYKEQEIQYFTANNIETKAALVERFNRTIKGKMYKLFTRSGSHRYIEFLPSIIKTYNDTVHRSIQMKPSEVTHDNEKKVFKVLYGFKDKRQYLLQKKKVTNIKIGDTVRQRYEPESFEKGFYPTWTDETNTVTSVKRGPGKVMYKLADGNRNYYDEDIQKIKKDPNYRIDKVIKVRTRNGIRQYFVSWLNYASSFNSWVNAEDVHDIA